LILFSFSCEKKYDWEPTKLSKSEIVIEAHLTNERKSHQIRLTSVYQNINGSPILISGADVKVYYQDTFCIFTELDSGIYYSDSSFQTIIQQEYFLKVSLNDNEYEASSFSIPVLGLDSLQYEMTNDSLYRISNISSGISAEEVMYEIRADWSHLPGNDTLPFNDVNALWYEYTLSSIDEHQIFSASKQDVKFPLGAIVIIKKYSLTPDHSAFIRGLLSETDWRGSAFDVAPANLPTNITGGALGFFGVSSVIVDTTIIN
jgi:hypothetical protein